MTHTNPTTGPDALPAYVLVLLDAGDADAEAYKQAVAVRPALAGRVELKFARGPSALEQAADVQVIVGGRVPDDLLAAAPRLRWIAFWSAGLDGKVGPAMLERKLLVTNASGVHAPNIAEQVLGWMLAFSRQFPTYWAEQEACRWNRSAATRMSELSGQTLGIVGLGHIGEAVAQRAHAFGMRILGAERAPRGRSEQPGIIDSIVPAGALGDMVGECDHICISVPHTQQTHRLFDGPMIARCKRGAYLYNIARGGIVDEAALADAIRSGHIAGAGLDVFETEPLPAESPLWSLPGVLITPHVAGVTPHYFARASELFARSLEDFLDGRQLPNRYDPDRGY